MMNLLETIFSVLIVELFLLIIVGFLFSVFEFWLTMGILAYFSTDDLLGMLALLMTTTVVITVVCYGLGWCAIAEKKDQ